MVLRQGGDLALGETHADALRNLVVTAVFRVALHANVPGWSPGRAT